MIIQIEITNIAITDYLEAHAVEKGVTLAELVAEVVEHAVGAASDNH